MRSRLAFRRCLALLATAPVPIAAAQECLRIWQPVGAFRNSGNFGALTVFDDGNGPWLYLGGLSMRVNNVQLGSLGRWNGAVAEAVPFQFGPVSRLDVFDLGTGPALYATAGSQLRRWNGAGWDTVGSGQAGNLMSLAVYDDGTGKAIYATGGNRLWKQIPNNWTAVATFISSDCAPLTLKVFDDGSGEALYVAGSFRTIVDVGEPNTYHGVAKLTGANTWTPVGAVGGVTPVECNTRVYALEVFDDGRGSALYAGGYFNVAGQVPRAAVARWTGEEWLEIGATALLPAPGTRYVSSLRVLDDGSGRALYAGGTFNNFAGQPLLSVARWDGRGWSGLGDGIANVNQGGGVVALQTYPDTGPGHPIFGAGVFSTVNGTATTSPSLAAFGQECVCPDLDGDGVVDQDDLDQVLYSFNVNAGGDIDGDLITRQFDLELALYFYGQTCP